MDKKKKPYTKPAYEVEEIFEKMSLICHDSGIRVCKAQKGVRPCTGWGNVLS